MPQPFPQAPPCAQAVPHMHTCVSSPLFRHPLYGPDLRDAYAHARRLGLCPDDAEDCAMDLLLHKLARHKPFGQDAALRRRCAHNFALDVLRASRRRASATSDVKDVVLLLHKPDTCLGPEQVVMCRAFWGSLQPFLNALPSDYAPLLLGHYRDGLTVRELARAVSRGEAAVEQSLVRALIRLRKLLVQAGVRNIDLFESLPR